MRICVLLTGAIGVIVLLRAQLQQRKVFVISFLSQKQHSEIFLSERKHIDACRIRPAASEDVPDTDWFNIFVLHQNRVPHSQNAKNCIREGYLARFLDFVIWGHEHECISEPWVSSHANISQFFSFLF